MGRIRLSPFRSVVPLSRPDVALSRLAASLHGAIVSTAGRERLREAIEAWKKNGAPNEKSLAAFGLRAALAHDRPSGSGMAEPPPGTHYETHDWDGAAATVLVRDRPSGSGLREALDEIEAAIQVWKRPKVGATSGRGHALAADGDAAMAMSMINAAMVKLRALSGSSDPETPA
jgi:hypothetical protein